MEDADREIGDWNLLRTGRTDTELIVEPESTSAGWLMLVGLAVLLYGIGFLWVPLSGLPNWAPIGQILLGSFLCLLRALTTDTVLWDLRKKKAYRILSFAGSKWARRTYEGDEVFMVVVEATDRGYGLSMVTRFGRRYEVLPPSYHRTAVKEDAELLARYFDVPVKEGTTGVIPTARAGKSPILKWKKRPRTKLKAAIFLILLLLPLVAHVAGPLSNSFR